MLLTTSLREAVKTGVIVYTSQSRPYGLRETRKSGKDHMAGP